MPQSCFTQTRRPPTATHPAAETVPASESSQTTAKNSPAPCDAATAGAPFAQEPVIRIEDGRTRLLDVRDGRVAALPVEVGTVTEANAEISSGATAGEMAVVGEAARTIAPGMRVRVRAAGADGTS